MLTKMKLKKGDTVIVNTGAEKGKKGTILDIDRKTGKVTVKDINVRTKHVKARKQGQASKVSYFCEKCGKGVRLGVKVNEDGTKSRYCKSCNEMK